MSAQLVPLRFDSESRSSYADLASVSLAFRTPFQTCREICRESAARFDGEITLRRKWLKTRAKFRGWKTRIRTTRRA